jgi:predicted aspartyl protease
LAGILPARIWAAPEAGDQAGVAVPLLNVSGNHFAMQASIDGHPVLLALDTGAGGTAIDKKIYDHDVPPDATQQMPANVARLTAINGQHASTGWIQDLQAGPMHFGSGPVIVTDLSAVSGATSLSYKTKVVAGFVGADILTRYGAVIYWANHFIYFAAHAGGHLQVGPAALKAGWTAIPMEFTSGRHFAVRCSLSGSSHLILDTGATNTLIDKSVWATDITQGQPRKYMNSLNGITVVSPMRLTNWKIGNFPMTNTMVGVGKLPEALLNETTPSPGRIVGLLGSEWLYLRNAIIDVGGMTLYLKAPAA